MAFTCNGPPMQSVNAYLRELKETDISGFIR